VTTSPGSPGSPAPVSPIYDTIGQAYVAHRRADPRWEALVAEQIGDARAVVNVGAGTGSYEPAGGNRDGRRAGHAVVAVEPSSVMVSQRPPTAAPAVRASASALPLPTGWADVALGVCTVHHWDDWRAGLAEMQRVAYRQVILAIDFDLHATFWLLEDYLPEVGEHTRCCHPGSDLIAEALGATDVITLPVPRDMQDGVLGAYWCRPEAYLDPAVRANASGLALADPAVIARGVGALERDLSSGAWQRRHADLSAQDSVDLGYRLVVAGAD
jgi:SAM-dependent methyltransferase